MKAITAVSLSVCLQGIYLYLSESFARWRIYGILKTREFSLNYQTMNRRRNKIRVLQMILPENSNLILKAGNLGKTCPVQSLLILISLISPLLPLSYFVSCSFSFHVFLIPLLTLNKLMLGLRVSSTWDFFISPTFCFLITQRYSAIEESLRGKKILGGVRPDWGNMLKIQWGAFCYLQEPDVPFCLSPMGFFALHSSRKKSTGWQIG